MRPKSFYPVNISPQWVDGTIEPFRWTIDRDSKKVLSLEKPAKANMIKDPSSNEIVELEEYRVSLSTKEATGLFEKAMEIEKVLGIPEDIEWTKRFAQK